MNTVQFTASTDLVTGCDHSPKPDSTPCGDTDGNACTTAGCDAGQCNQTHVTTPARPDGNACTNDLACNPQTGPVPLPARPRQHAVHRHRRNNAARRRAASAGQCNQTHVTTPCPPDDNACTNDLACNPQTGLCQYPPVPDSTPCTDTDNNACTTAGCERASATRPT